MNIVLLGAPGAGKGTQSQFICEKYAMPQISTGGMLRAAVEAGTPLGLQAKAIMDDGKLIPDDIIIQLVLDRIAQSDCQGGFLLDGFPRTIPQAQSLRQHHITLDHIIDIHVPDDEIIQRLSGRRIHLASGRTYHIQFCPPKMDGIDDVTGEALVQRDDDREETIRKRLAVYHEQTSPLIQYYQQFKPMVGETSPVFSKIDGCQNISDISKQIYAVLDTSS